MIKLRFYCVCRIPNSKKVKDQISMPMHEKAPWNIYLYLPTHGDEPLQNAPEERTVQCRKHRSDKP